MKSIFTLLTLSALTVSAFAADATTETLPSGKTETGTWAMQATKETFFFTQIASFAIPLKEALDGEHVHLVPATCAIARVEGESKAEEEEKEEREATCEASKKALEAGPCKGTVEEPKAAPGNFCVYATSLENTVIASIVTPGVKEGAGKPGALALVSVSATGRGWGSWAVTAE